MTDIQAAVFLDAAQLIENAPRLAKGAYERRSNNQTCYCIVGALTAALYTHKINRPQTRDEYAKRLALHLGLVRRPPNELAVDRALFRWNDKQERTKAEVAAALRSMADTTGASFFGRL
jgi:hypothetical protein